MLHRSFGLEIKSADEAGVIEGYGSTFDDEPDSYGDVVMKGAYTDTLAAHKSAGTMPMMLWGHQSGELPIGDWLDMEEDDKGLFVKGQVDLDDPVGERVHRALKRKSVRGLSIGYETLQSSPDPKRKGVRRLEKLDLWEVSPVNFPAKHQAQITGVKGEDSFAAWMAGGRPHQRELETYLKEGFGVSNSEAERMANALLHEDRGGRDVADPLAGFWDALRTAPIVDMTGE